MSNHVAWKNLDGTLGGSSDPKDVPADAVVVDGDPFEARTGEYRALVAEADAAAAARIANR